jgi:hypothetical protein
MKWIIFTGTWRLTNKEVEHDVRMYARKVFERGDGMVTGGATGVDFFAMDEWLKLNPECTKIRIFIPARLDHFIRDYRKNWKHDPVTDRDIDDIEYVLALIKERNPSAIFEVRKDSGDITQEEYDIRHNEEVTFSDDVYAFQVNNSTGTQDTIDKAKQAGLPVSVHKKYTI